jgi:tetratricopeptide (TPR) repeat protein
MAAARYVQAGRCVEAYRCYLRATQLKPGHADWCFWLSVLAYEMKNVAQAVQHVQEAVQLDPRNGDYQLQLGWLAYVAGELDKSIDASRRAAELLPSQPIASFNAGLALLAKGEATSAIAEYEKALLACSELRPIEAGAAIQAALTDLDNLLETRKDLSSAILDVEFRLRQKIAGHSSISFH